MVHYVECPVCKTRSIHYFISANDNTVSNERFEIWQCDNCRALFTQDIPEEDKIGDYYASPEYVSHSDTQDGLVNQLYHKVRNITLWQKKNLVEKETGVAAGKILDIGAGTGAFLNKMKQHGWQVMGVEPDPGARLKAASLYNVQAMPSEELFNLPAHGFDAISLWHVLEHVHRLHEYVEQAKKLLAPKGRIFVAVPNYTSADARHYKEYWAAFDVPRHLYHFSPDSMNVLMNMHGLKIKKIKPMWFDSFYVSMLSEEYRNAKSNMFKALLSGVSSNAVAVLNKERASSLIYIIGA